MFSPCLPLPALITWCRALRHGLHAGLSPVKVFRQQGKSGHAAARTLADTLADRLKKGDSLEDALKPHRSRFPLMFVELVSVGERAGKLPEVFEELEKYFDGQLSARRSFLQAIVWPAMSYVVAVVVMALMVTILALLGGHVDPFGLAKLGPLGGVLILVIGFGFAAVVTLLYLVARDNDQLKQKFEAVGIRIPGLTACYRSFALQRFSMALSMTHEAGMRADESVALSFRATANGAYVPHADPAARAVRGGKSITKALAAVKGGLFPEEFIDSLQVGEDSGQLSEVMNRVAEQYREEALRQTKVLARIAGGAVYAMVGLMLIALIIRIFVKAYMEPLNEAMKMNGM